MVSVVVVRTLRPTDGPSSYLCFPQRKLSEGIRCSDPRAQKAWGLAGSLSLLSCSLPGAPTASQEGPEVAAGDPSRAGVP